MDVITVIVLFHFQWVSFLSLWLDWKG